MKLFQVAIWKGNWVETNKETGDGYDEQEFVFPLQSVFAYSAKDARVKAILRAKLSEKDLVDCYFACQKLTDES